MTQQGLLWAQDHTVAMDYGHFYLQHRVVGDDLDDEAYDDLDPSDLISRANDGDGIAWEAGTLAVLSPHQNNFEMPLRVELLDSEPAGDLDDWEDAFEAYLEWENGGLSYKQPDNRPGGLPRPAGRLPRPDHRPWLRRARMARQYHTRRQLAAPAVAG